MFSDTCILSKQHLYQYSKPDLFGVADQKLLLF